MKSKILLVISIVVLVGSTLLPAGCSGDGSETTAPAAPGAAAPGTQAGQSATVGAETPEAQTDALGDQVERSLRQLTDANAAGDSLDDVTDLQ